MNIPRASIWPNQIWDTTDPDEMAEAVEWVRSLVTESPDRPLCRSESVERGDNGATWPDKPGTDVQHGDTWTVRDGQAVVVGSNRWPAPRPQDHESQRPVSRAIPDGTYAVDQLEWIIAADWAELELAK